MDELKQLIELVVKLPNTALWILAGYAIYKLAIVGSIYGTIKFGIEKLYDAYIAKVRRLDEPKRVVYTWKEGVEPISEEVKTQVVNALLRLKAVEYPDSKFAYVHDSFATTLDKLVNEYISTAPAKK